LVCVIRRVQFFRPALSPEVGRFRWLSAKEWAKGI
jgi:hypothetical protein